MKFTKKNILKIGAAVMMTAMSLSDSFLVIVVSLHHRLLPCPVPHDFPGDYIGDCRGPSFLIWLR